LYRRGFYSFALPLCIVNAETPTPGSDKISLGCSAQASHIVAECYEFGLGVAADREEAIRWYQRAAEVGWSTRGGVSAALHDLHRLGHYKPVSVDEQRSIAWHYRYGDPNRVSGNKFVQPDMKEALRWYAH
jgi:TPR repeat protein